MKSFLVFCVVLALGSVQGARIRRQAATAAPVPSTTPKTAGMNVALGFMVDELDKETALGGPVNPAGLKKANIMAMKIQMLGGDVDAPTKEKLDSLNADFLLEAAAPPQYAGVPGAGSPLDAAAKPADTKVNFGMFGR
ncbi:uncharacterized protein TNCV_2677861 [Trichonephila clavipes]|nr:uncharacterized protein TNCV_2677861 [Trichonephila clavipes]